MSRHGGWHNHLTLKHPPTHLHLPTQWLWAQEAPQAASKSLICEDRFTRTSQMLKNFLLIIYFTSFSERHATGK